MTTKTFWRYFIEDDNNHTIKYGISEGEQPPNNVTLYDKIETLITKNENGILLRTPYTTKEHVIECKSGFEYIILLNVTKTSWLNGEEEY